MSIYDLVEKIKSWIEGDDWRDGAVIGIIVLVGVGSFFLGRLSKTPTKTIVANVTTQINEKAPIGREESILQGRLPEGEQRNNFVASKNGTKYYSLDCSGVDRIKEENKIYFTTETEAQATGRLLSSTCK